MTDRSSPEKKPIGVFDSGLGGLTVLAALRQSLPSEDFIYLGDTARLPYGAKSHRIVERYSFEVADFLLGHEAKLIVIACNTATAHAEASLKQKLPVPVLGVIEPGVRALGSASKNGRVGVIGTRSTIKSGAYTKAIHKFYPKLEVFARACPLFVPLVEEGWTDKKITSLVIQEYLSEMAREQVDTIVLGCTHYPLLKASIQKEFPKIRLIDSSEEIARSAKARLTKEGLLSGGMENPSSGKTSVFLTDLADQMSYLETLLRGMNIDRLEEVRL